MKTQAFFLLSLALCACASTTEPVTVSKASLAMDGKADSSAVAALCRLLYGEPCDLCDRQGWYGDGQCDAFCQAPDPDCGAGTCTYDGVVYSDGEGFASTDGCNSCGCNDGDVVCTELDCGPAPASCEYNGMTYQDGEGFPSTDGCNGCGCNDGQVSCTELLCEPEPSSSCIYYGKEYKHGESFGAADGCNSCGCDDGSVYCTEAWCGHPSQGYACADKLCGDECIPDCPENDPNCSHPDVIHQCNADGACLPKTATCS